MIKLTPKQYLDKRDTKEPCGSYSDGFIFGAIYALTDPEYTRRFIDAISKAEGDNLLDPRMVDVAFRMFQDTIDL